MKKTLSQLILGLALTAAIAAPQLSEAADANLVYIQASRMNNAYGPFPGIPGGGGGLADDATCQLAAGSMDRFRLIRDIPRRHRGTKRRLEQVFSNSFMKTVMDRVVTSRRIADPSVSDEDARTIYVLVHDCTFDGLGVGPAVLPLKGLPTESTYESKKVPWVLLLSDASFGTIEQLVGDAGIASRVVDDVIAHEFMHGMTADLLTRENVIRSNEFKDSDAHHAEIQSDVSTAFWEGMAEGIEAGIGYTIPGAFHPFTLGGLGQYIFVLERQEPVRNNAYVYEKTSPRSPLRRFRAPLELMKSEGFIATVTFRLLNVLPYRMTDGTMLRGWPYQAFAQMFKDHQPVHTVEFLKAIFATPNGGREAMMDFIELTQGATADPEAFLVANARAVLESRLETVEEQLRRNPADATALTALQETREQLDGVKQIQNILLAQIRTQVSAGALDPLGEVPEIKVPKN